MPRRSYDRSRLVSPDAHLLREGADVGNPNEDLNPIRLYPNAEAPVMQTPIRLVHAGGVGRAHKVRSRSMPCVPRCAMCARVGVPTEAAAGGMLLAGGLLQ